MAGDYIDYHINKNSKAILKEVKGFTSKLLNTTGIELDSQADPSANVLPDSPLWQVIAAYRELDLHTMNIPDNLGGMQGLDGLTRTLIKESLGAGDLGLSMGLLLSDLPFHIAAHSHDSAHKKLATAYCDDREGKLIGCVMGGDGISPSSLTGSISSDGIVLNGAAPNVINGSIATHAFARVQLKKEGDDAGTPAMALFSLDQPGIVRGTPTTHNGIRTLNQCEIRFADVNLPLSCLLAPEDGGEQLNAAITMSLFLDMGALYSGLAQSSLTLAKNYAQTRIQGGVPIIQHQNVKLALFQMFEMIESVSAFARQLALYGEKIVPAHAVALKRMATKTAVRTSSDAIQIFGGNGLAKEYPVEKLFREAQAGTVSLGENNWMAILSTGDI